ncbi:MAG: hypothetical protein K2X79_06580, partial [Burkholderiaceae bacterium]|nr:hypothetical protein [Burkholderiaceae bacterium]
MTDAFEVTGEFAPAENLSVPANTVESLGETAELGAADAVETVEAPNGFVELGLAPELVQACK